MKGTEDMAPSSRARTPDGVDLAVYDFGGDGRPLLLAHATGFHARTWVPVVERLRDRFHCYAFDERGHGDSTSPPDGDFDWHRYGADALAVLDHLGLADARPLAVGHSCGGALLLLAELARPSTFEALYCFEPVVWPVDEVPTDRSQAGNNPLAIAARKRREEFESFDAALANFAAKPPMSGFDPEALRLYVAHGFEEVPGGVRLKCRGEDEARTYENGPYHGAYLRLHEIQCPVTLAFGEHTNAFGEGVMRANAARLRSARVEMLPGLSHFGPMEDPAALAASIRWALG